MTETVPAMTNILILGDNGQFARVATTLFLARPDVRLTPYLRKARRLKVSAPADRVRVVEGDVLSQKSLESAMAGQDVVYANLAGELEQQARCIVAAMRQTGLKRLIFISSMGSQEILTSCNAISPDSTSLLAGGRRDSLLWWNLQNPGGTGANQRQARTFRSKGGCPRYAARQIHQGMECKIPVVSDGVPDGDRPWLRDSIGTFR